MKFIRLCLNRLGLLFIALLYNAFVQAADEPRYAIVVGNSNYDSAPLKKPVNDARAIAAVLLEADFVTTVSEDANAEEFETAIDEFLDSLPTGAVGLFYYADHGVQREGRNLVLPTDFVAGDETQVMSNALSASDLIDRFHKRDLAFDIFVFIPVAIIHSSTRTASLAEAWPPWKAMAASH